MLPIVCSLIAYAVASGWEAYGHRAILHASPKTAKQWLQWGRIGMGMRQARFNHQIHHQLMTSSEWTRQRLIASAQLSPWVVNQLQETAFGESINPTLDALILFSGLPLLITVPLFLLTCPQWLPLGIVIALVPFMMTAYVHPHLHRQPAIPENGTKDSPLAYPLQQLLNSIREHHAEHHRHPWTNFNLMLGADSVVKMAHRIASRFSSRAQQEMPERSGNNASTSRCRHPES